MRKSAIIVLALMLALASGSAVLAKKPAHPAQMDDAKRALHALNRLTFGPRPGDVARVQAMGVNK
jgi:hypothetical protein